MNVLLTGAAGFLGSHLTDACLRRGDTVIGIDNFATSNGENVAHLRDEPRFRLIAADVCEQIPELGLPIDLIFHFASPASPRDYAEAALETLKVNAMGTLRCCELARETHARLIFASTSEVYGDPLVHPQSEAYWGNVNPNGERSCYDEGKRYGEATVAAFRREHALDARCIRIFNTYGPRMRGGDGRVVPAFITQALGGEVLTIFGDGTQTRSLCYVDDLIEGILRFAELANPHYWVMNLGSDHEVSVKELASTIARLCGTMPRTVHRPAPPDDPARRRPDLTRARQMLGWKPRTPLEAGLDKTIAWFRAQHAEPAAASIDA
jgi:dTDP-glucose 4,6-dehydratase